jgi:hypothetical protein
MTGVGTGTITVLARPPGSVAGETWTIEIGADGSTLAVRSSVRGTFPTGVVGNTYQITPPGYQTPTSFFTVTAGAVNYEPGDAFVLDTGSSGLPVGRSQSSHGGGFNVFNGPTVPGTINLSGWWEILGYAQLPHYLGGQVKDGDELLFTKDIGGGYNEQYSWLVFVRKVRQQPTNNVIGYEVHYRDLELTVQSGNTKFWFNDVDQLLDADTKKRVFDNVKILRSNLDSSLAPLGKSQVYDVTGAVKDSAGLTDFSKLTVVPTDLLQEDSSGDLIPDRLLQFETFSSSSYEYFRLDNSAVLLDPILDSAEFAAAATGTYAAGAFVENTLTYGRRQRMPSILNEANDSGLDFMWQHFAPFTNIIDPSVTNIHDAYILTQGYYDSVISHLRGLSTTAPTAPTPLDLRSSYSYLLKNKMLSDTVVMHPGKLRLLFGTLAEPQFRAKFKIIRQPSGTLTNERIKEELLTVVNEYFDIRNWDFGETFYATELISLMHTRLPADIAAVALVPLYSTNSFGDLYTVQCGFDEILQSAAQLSDFEIVEALTPTVIRQIK